MITRIDGNPSLMKLLPSFCVLLALICSFGCAHRTSMSDPALRDLWNGVPMPAGTIEEAAKKWPNDVTLLELQEGFALLRKGNFSKEARADAKRYFERAAMSFDDLKQPNNFSVAFTADANTPYRGRPYERVLASMFLGILDMADGRCDMAIPAFKSAEFLDARWQPFQFGTDAPMVYALNLRCLIHAKASQGDIVRSKEGLFRSLRMLEGVDGIRSSLENEAHDLENQDPSVQIAFIILDAGISSALMESDMKANAEEILDRVVTDSIRFYVQVLSNKDDSMYETLKVFADKLEKRIGSKDKAPSAQAIAQIDRSLRSLIRQANSGGRLNAKLERAIEKASTTTDAIYSAVSKPKTRLLFEGVGPSVVAEGQYSEIARVVPKKESDAKASVDRARFSVVERCGIHQRSRGLDIVLCDEKALQNDEGQPEGQDTWTGVKLWSSSYQATSMVGRRFDKILKGRAEFRMGTETAALIGAVTAVALLEIGSQLADECRRTGRNCEAAQNMQIAGAVAGLLAGGAWLAGRAVNPEADTRHVTDAFESGYLMLQKED